MRVRFWYENLPSLYQKIVRNATVNSNLYYFLFVNFDERNIRNYDTWQDYFLYETENGKMIMVNANNIFDLQQLIHDAVFKFYQRSKYLN